MWFTGVEGLDHSIDTTNLWLSDVASGFGTSDRRLAYVIVVAARRTGTGPKVPVTLASPWPCSRVQRPAGRCASGKEEPPAPRPGRLHPRGDLACAAVRHTRPVAPAAPRRRKTGHARRTPVHPHIARP